MTSYPLTQTPSGSSQHIRYLATWGLVAAALATQGCGDTGTALEPEPVYVERIVDGDTIKLEDGRTIRYIGVDTPEIAHNSTQTDDCYGPEASDFNAQLVAGKAVTLEYDEELTDHYGRTLAYVWLGTGDSRRMVNEELLFRGFGHLLIIEPNSAYEERLAEAERSAQERGAGLWTACTE